MEIVSITKLDNGYLIIKENGEVEYVTEYELEEKKEAA